MKKQQLEWKISEYSPDREPFYLEIDDEVKIAEDAYDEKIPITLKGPTGCGKSRFIQYMAYRINQRNKSKSPLVTVSCHEDLTADDLKGRYLLSGEFEEGPALVAVKRGGFLYLDEVVEARQDTVVVIHPLGDDRRVMTVERLGKVFEAPDSFGLFISYNPGYQKKTKDLKQSTKQRFVALNFSYPPKDIEAEIIRKEAGVEQSIAEALTEVGAKIRNAKGRGLEEGASTRLLINAGKLIRKGNAPLKACEVAILNPITDDIEAYRSVHEGLADVVRSFFPE